MSSSSTENPDDGAPDGATSAEQPQLLIIGRVTRPHGLNGEVTVDLLTDRTERLDPGTELHTDHGVVVVQRSRHQDRHRWLVVFDGVDSREAADAMRGVVLSAEPVDVPGTLWVHELIGCRVVSKNGTERGTVVSVLANPASDLLELDSGALVPLVFVAGDIDNGAIRLDEPDGLFDL